MSVLQAFQFIRSSEFISEPKATRHTLLRGHLQRKTRMMSSRIWKPSTAHLVQLIPGDGGVGRVEANTGKAVERVQRVHVSKAAPAQLQRAGKVKVIEGHLVTFKAPCRPCTGSVFRSTACQGKLRDGCYCTYGPLHCRLRA